LKEISVGSTLDDVYTCHFLLLLAYLILTINRMHGKNVESGLLL